MKKQLKDLKAKTIVALREQENVLRGEIAKLTVESKTASTKDTNVISKKRKELARLLTVTNEKIELEAMTAKNKSSK